MNISTFLGRRQDEHSDDSDVSDDEGGRHCGTGVSVVTTGNSSASAGDHPGLRRMLIESDFTASYYRQLNDDLQGAESNHIAQHPARAVSHPGLPLAWLFKFCYSGVPVVFCQNSWKVPDAPPAPRKYWKIPDHTLKILA